MKFSAVALVSATIAVSAVASPHAHQHNHQHLHHKRGDPAKTIVVPGPTILSYVLNGQPISEAEVQEGIKNGTLVYAKDGKLDVAPAKAPLTYAAPPPPAPTPAPAPKPAPQPAPKPAPKPASNGPLDHSTSCVDKDFPDGELSCSTFPSDFGAMAVNYMDLDGWIGVQQPQDFNGGYGAIRTLVKGMFSPGGACSEGSYCSYACPMGYQKSQWPDTQGSTGQSVGGIKCSGGKLHLTNPGLSKKLCVPGDSPVKVMVQNKCGSNVPICRTDYPGTEAETVPLDTTPGQSFPLTCPNANSYYKWQGGKTSAQYYVNPQGTSVQDGCQWGDGSKPIGNWAPVNFGVGYSNGAAWLAILQNAPTTTQKLDYPIEIKLDGAGSSGVCKYQNGQYCGGADGSDCNDKGCTVSIQSGTATFVMC